MEYDEKLYHFTLTLSAASTNIVDLCFNV